jgi:hypothetical protein
MIIERFPRAPRTMRAILVLSLLSSAAACQRTSKAPGDSAAVNRKAAPQPKATPAPEANVFVDEPRLAKPYAVVGGTVKNVGPQKLERLSVQVELRRRDDNTIERREVGLEPADLAPGEQGKFALKVKTDEFRGSSVVGLRSGARDEDVAFVSLPGAKRPPERLPERVVNVRTPKQKPRSAGDEFINTPDTPIKVP